VEELGEDEGETGGGGGGGELGDGALGEKWKGVEDGEGLGLHGVVGVGKFLAELAAQVLEGFRHGKMF
jgi:hypothetical protein